MAFVFQGEIEQRTSLEPNQTPLLGSQDGALGFKNILHAFDSPRKLLEPLDEGSTHHKPLDCVWGRILPYQSTSYFGCWHLMPN